MLKRGGDKQALENAKIRMRMRETNARNSHVKSNIYCGLKRHTAFKRGKYNDGGGTWKLREM